MDEPQDEGRSGRLRSRVRQLILMRETGPKSRAWHAARVRLIWRLHDELRAAEQAGEAATDATAPYQEAPTQQER